MPVVSVSEGTFRVEIEVAKHHRLTADESERLGGTDAGPDPFDLLMASLGACTAIAVVDAAKDRGITVDRVAVSVTQKPSKLCTRPGDPELQIVELRRSMEIDGAMSAEDREWLYARGADCPISRTLASGVRIVTTQTELA